MSHQSVSYVGTLKLAICHRLTEFVFRRFDNHDGSGDPTAFFPDVLTCLRLPACDQLLILDCCFAAKAFAREHVGKRKFELLTSAAHDARSPAPKSEHSFTRTLTTALRSLLQRNPKGFHTSDLYREVYHTISPHPATTKPLLFDQSRHNFGKIWLTPQLLSNQPPKAKEEGGGGFLKLTFRLNEDPDLAVMNELALALQYLPHVDQIKFDDLYAPREQIANFMHAVFQAQKIKPLVRRMQARRKLRKVAELKAGDSEPKASTSLLKLHLEQNHRPLYDWSDAKPVGHNPQDSEGSRDRRRKNSTWPPTQGQSINGSSSEDKTSTELYVHGPGTLVTNFVPGRVHAMDTPAPEQTDDTFPFITSRQRHDGDHLLSKWPALADGSFISCEPCKASRQKCNGSRPVCQRCGTCDIRCTYADDKEERPISRGINSERIAMSKKRLETHKQYITDLQKGPGRLQKIEREHQIDFGAPKDSQTMRNQDIGSWTSPVKGQYEHIIQASQLNLGHQALHETLSLGVSRFRAYVLKGEEYTLVNSMKLWVQHLTGEPWDWWPFRQSFRPLLRDEVRIRWHCVSYYQNCLIPPS